MGLKATFNIVPYGLSLGPLLFSLYLFSLAQALGIEYYFYAGDTQIYIHCKFGQREAVSFLPKCNS